MQEETSKQERGIGKNKAKLAKNGYGAALGNCLIDLKLAIENQFDPEMDFRIKTTVLRIFNFMAMLNLEMLLTDRIQVL